METTSIFKAMSFELRKLSGFYGCDPLNALFKDASSLREYKPSQNPLGIILAPTGMLPVKPNQIGRIVTPHIPIDSSEIIETVISCYELGIGAVHLHARHHDGRPTQDPEVFAQLIDKISAYCPDIIIGVTTSGRNDPSYEGRSRVLDIPGIDIASLTLTSVQFPQATVVAKEEIVVKLLKKMISNQIKPEFEFFDIGGINMIKRLQSKNQYPEGPVYCNLFLGNISSLQTDLFEMNLAINSLPVGSYCGLAGFGGFQLKANVAAIVMGGMMHVRTGLEDNIYFDRERKILATNESLVKRITQIAEIFERPIATPVQMRQMIGLKPGSLIHTASKLHENVALARKQDESFPDLFNTVHPKRTNQRKESEI